MGKKYIITENQEKIIRRLVERELGPEESILVTKKNPFNYDELEDARFTYNSSLQDGDLFYVYDKKKACQLINTQNLNTIKKVFPSIVGKTIRANDKVYAIGRATATISEGGRMIVIQVELRDLNTLEQFKTYSGFWSPSETRSDTGWTAKQPSFDYVTVSANRDYVMIPLQKAYGSEIQVLKNDFCLSDIAERTGRKPIGIENVPDELFEIRKIQRTKTDF